MTPPAVDERRWLARCPRGSSRAALAVVTAAVLVGFAAFLVGQSTHIAETYALRPRTFAAVAGLILTTLALRSLANQRLFRCLGVSASTWDWFRLVTVESLSNTLPFSAGLVAKAVYLKRVHAFPYGSFALGQVSLMVMILATNGALGLAALFLRLPASAASPIGAAFALMAASGVLLFLPEPIARRIGGRWLPAEAASPAVVRRAGPGVALLQAAILLTNAASLKLCFALGPSEVEFAACVVFSTAIVLTRLAPITPGGIGIRELLIGGLAHATGFDLSDAVIAATAVRIVETGIIFTLGGVFTTRLAGMAMESPREPPRP